MVTADSGSFIDARTVDPLQPNPSSTLDLLFLFSRSSMCVNLAPKVKTKHRFVRFCDVHYGNQQRSMPPFSIKFYVQFWKKKILKTSIFTTVFTLFNVRSIGNGTPATLD